MKATWIIKGMLSLLITLCIILQVSGQKYILIERSGNPKTTRISMYEEITFKLKDDKAGWYTRQILDMDAQGQMVLLGDTWVAIQDISKIRLGRKRVFATIIGGALQVGGITMFIGDLWYTATNQPEYSEDGMLFGLINFVAGTLIRATLGPIIYKMGKHRRLRVVDLTF